jgi:hypothetical protein
MTTTNAFRWTSAAVRSGACRMCRRREPIRARDVC